jgi:hypothetical protein
MSLTSLPPLDLQTENLGPQQHPTTWLLIVVAVIAMGGLFVSWAVHQDSFASGGPSGRLVPGAAPHSAIDQAVVARIAGRRH